MNYSSTLGLGRVYQQTLNALLEVADITSMSQKFVVSHLDQQMGPFDENELKVKWVAGEILPIDYVYDEAKQDWVLLADRFSWASAAKASIDAAPTPPPIKEKEKAKEPEKEKELKISLEAPQPPPPVQAKSTPPPPKKDIPADDPSMAVTNPTISLGQPIESRDSGLWKMPVGQGARVKLVDGVGELDLSLIKPGNVELVLQDASSGMLKLQEPLRIQVQASDPAEIVWAFPNQQVVGQDVEVLIKALDSHGNICSQYNDQFLIEIRGPISQDVDVQLVEGQAVVTLNHTKAETWTMSLHYSGMQSLNLPEARHLNWQPGPATRLILDGPGQYMAGQPLKVQVKAVDNYGNLAKTFQGTVILEVKAG